jgi:hypothetical protein
MVFLGIVLPHALDLPAAKGRGGRCRGTGSRLGRRLGGDAMVISMR